MKRYSILLILFVKTLILYGFPYEKNLKEFKTYEIDQLIREGETFLEESPGQSLSIASNIIELYSKNPNSNEYLRALFLKAKANTSLENYKPALTDFSICNTHPYFINDTALLAELKFNMARCYDCLSDIRSAIEYYQKALKLYQAKKNMYGQAKVLQNIGIIESDRRKDSLAMSYYVKALEIYKLLDNKAKQAAILQNIGVIYSNQENYDKTIEHYNKALKIFMNLKNLEGIATVENNLGLTYERELKFDEALKHYRNSMFYFKKLNSRSGLAYIHDNMASLYRRLKKNDKAIHHYKLSLQYADSVHILDFIAFVNKELAGLYEEMGNYERSLHYFKTGVQIEDSISTDESRKKLSEAETFFQNELKDIDIQKKEFQLEIQKRQNAIYMGSVVLLLLMLTGLIWAYRKKTIAENKLKKHQEFLEVEVLQRTQELKNEVFEREAAEEADKLKTAFLANMSHEIRTPMNAILAFSNYLKDPDISGAQRSEYVKYINSCSISLLHLIDDILDTAKIEAKQLKLNVSQCYVNSILNELFVYFQNHRKCQENDIVLVVKTSNITKNFSITTDITRLRQIFSNLLDNAFKFTEQGRIEFGFEISNGFIEFYVKDTGSGIPRDKTEFVFKRFGQVNDNSHKLYKGTGLGLAISKNLAELLGGKMWLDSVEGEGSAFYFTIPAIDLEITELLETKDEAYKLPEGIPSWGNYNILVAEDDELNYKLLEIALNKSHINVHRAKNGEEVLKLLPGNFHLVLMDIQMPVLDGYETTRLLKMRHPDIFVIAQTAFAMSDDREKCLKAGCDDYISKPIDIDELYSKLGCYLERVQR
jgi:signal transduction histidine kinase/CheY-like chemotaxis protein